MLGSTDGSPIRFNLTPECGSKKGIPKGMFLWRFTIFRMEMNRCPRFSVGWVHRTLRGWVSGIVIQVVRKIEQLPDPCSYDRLWL
ncbi:hypothetical protein CBD41_00320 [bacterium TMED181]|nr:hypothetical protein [Planctomycetota bacterium]OUW47798.1 MAG: hypothetical protein CBD41_00320 [bacterium TMED181]